MTQEVNLIRAKKVKEILGIRCNKLFGLAQLSPEFPKPIKLHPRAKSVWLESDIYKYIEIKKNQSMAEANAA